MTFERWNTHFDTSVDVDVLGVHFNLVQDPNSHNLGTTVWDASLVLAKFIEKNSKKGDFSRVRAKGRRCLELGSGMGLGGLAFALLGADVTLTDLAPILPLLERNYTHNLSPAVLRVGDASWAADVVGKVSVAELDWSQPEQYANFTPPYDYILAADCVYSELAVPSFLATVLAMSNHKSSVVIVNEFRSQSVHDTFMAAFNQHFIIKKVTPSKMDPHYQHDLIHIYLCKRKKQPSAQGHAEHAEQASVHVEALASEEHSLATCGAAIAAGQAGPVPARPAAEAAASGGVGGPGEEGPLLGQAGEGGEEAGLAAAGDVEPGGTQQGWSAAVGLGEASSAMARLGLTRSGQHREASAPPREQAGGSASTDALGHS